MESDPLKIYFQWDLGKLIKANIFEVNVREWLHKNI